MPLIFLAGFFWMVASFFALGDPVNLDSPSGSLGSASAQGFVEIWDEVQDVEFGGGVALPFRFQFSSDPGRESAFFGKGWWIPLLEAKALMINETTMRAELLCGKVLYLHTLPGDQAHFQTNNLEWKGVLDSVGDFIVSREDGWMLRYHQSRLTELKTDKGRDFFWDYVGGVATSLTERGDAPALTVEMDGAGHPAGFVINSQRYKFSLARRPMLEWINGKPAVGELAPTLASFQSPAGDEDKFKFSLQPDKNASLEATMGGQASRYTWDTLGHILSDQDWTYAVGPPIEGSTLPTLGRTNLAGQSETLAIVTKTGQIFQQDVDGVVTQTQLFRSPGVLFNQVRQIIRTKNGVTTLVAKRSYDELGRLIRAVDEGGVVTTYNYDTAGKLAGQSVHVDPKVLSQLQKEADEMANAIAKTTDPVAKYQLQQKLGYFYVHQMKENQRALDFAATCADPGVAYRISLESIFYDDNLNNQQKMAAYRKLLPLYPQCEKGLQGLIADMQGN